VLIQVRAATPSRLGAVDSAEPIGDVVGEWGSDVLRVGVVEVAVAVGGGAAFSEQNPLRIRTIGAADVAARGGCAASPLGHCWGA
jgi:hypothetical protein